MDNAVEQWAKEAAVIAETKTAETINMLIRYIGEIIYQVIYFGMLLGQAFIAAVIAETKTAETINMLIRYIGEIIYQVIYFGMLLGQAFMMNVLKIFCPVAFALSIVPPWASAWSQWISKYVSLSLWAPLIYMCSIYADMILKYTILQDTTAYTTLLGSASYTWGEIGGLGMQGIGSTCMYVVGLLVGAMLIKFVPELASWIVPGGASSSIGSAVSSMTTAGAAAVGGAAGGFAGSSISVTRKTLGSVVRRSAKEQTV